MFYFIPCGKCKCQQYLLFIILTSIFMILGLGCGVLIWGQLLESIQIITMGIFIMAVAFGIALGFSVAWFQYLHAKNDPGQNSETPRNLEGSAPDSANHGASDSEAESPARDFEPEKKELEV